MRPRPASLRQQPKRRFSMYVSSPNEAQPSTSNAQPPISLRLKRIPDPLSDGQKMPPPLIKSMPIKKIDKLDLCSLEFKYLCKYCSFQTDSFERTQLHWLRVHKINDYDPISKRFCYRITCRVKCIYCTNDVTFLTIRAHMKENHPNCTYAFAKYNQSLVDKLQCGICLKDMINIVQLNTHFVSNHAQSQLNLATLPNPIEPLHMINDSFLDMLIQQGDRGTFKCLYCKRFFTCRYDFEQHHRQEHPMKDESYEQNGKDIIKYGCYMCTCTPKTNERDAIEHLRSHIPPVFECLHCNKHLKTLKLMQIHHTTDHEELEIEFKLVSLPFSYNAFYQMVLTFSNGLTLLWGDVANTKYGDVNRLIKFTNDLNEMQTYHHLNLLKGIKTASRSNSVGKIGQRRQTLL